MASLYQRDPSRSWPMLTAIFLGVALGAWLLVIARMRGMDAGPGTDVGTIGWFLGIWVTMMAAMMLPSVWPVVVMYVRTVSRSGEGVPAWAGGLLFTAGYFAAWTALGLAAYAVYRLIARLEDGALAWDEAGPYVAGASIVVAGLYQLSPLKSACLSHCRSPIHFLMHRWRDGPFGAIRMGAEHGVVCVGCCWGLVLVLFALGVMSLFWMALVTAVIFAEKVLPRGDRITKPLAVVLVALGMWIAVAPDSVPGLTNPSAPAMTRVDEMEG
jgi:predicted metal-binding membrane protein